MRPRHERLWLAGLLIASFCLNLYRLGAPSLFDQDESEYAQIAVEMVHTGDPVTLHVNGEPWYVHPPLYMWLVAATGRLFDFNELTIRIWSVLGSLLAVYATVLLGRDLWTPRVGLLAGTILALTLQYLMQSRLAVFDTVLLAWMLLALHAFVRGYRSGRRSDFIRFFLFAGLATLTKGPIGLVLPGLIIAAFVALRRAWPRLREVPWGIGLAIYAAVGLSWYAAQIALHGRAFLSANVGYILNSNPKSNGSTLLDRPNEFIAGLGFDFPINKYFQPIAEFRSTQYVGSHTPNAFQNNPVEFLAGVKIYPARWWGVGAWYRRHLNQQSLSSFKTVDASTTIQQITNVALMGPHAMIRLPHDC